VRLATVKEACAYAKVGQTKLYAKINAGEVVADVARVSAGLFQ
jgi:hypothetical protein